MDGIPKSRVTLTYDTRQPEEQEGERELPFRMMILGDLGGSKNEETLPIEKRPVVQLTKRNVATVMKGLDIKKTLTLAGGKGSVPYHFDSLESFGPDEILRRLTGQVKGDLGLGTLPDAWKERENVVQFRKRFQNSKALRKALKKALEGPPPPAATAKEVT